jgi:hypothetical protein
MKKFLAVTLALGLCVAVAMPAAAAVSVSGDVGYEIKYDSYGEDDPSSVAANNNDNKGFSIHPAVSKANIRFDWEAGPATPYIDLQMNKYQTKWTQTRGGDMISDEMNLRFGVNYTHGSGVWGGAWEIDYEFKDTRATSIMTNARQDVDYYANIWWQVNPMLKLSFFDHQQITGAGKAAEKVGVFAHMDDRYVARAEMKFSMGKLTVDFIDPDDHGTVATGGTTYWMSSQEQNIGPAISASFAAKLGPIFVSPGYTTQSFEYVRGVAGAGPAAGSDDGYTAWTAIIPVKGALGPVNLSGAYAWGENISDAFAKDAQTKTKNGAAWAADVVTYSPSAGVVRFDDTEYRGWNIDASINAGIGTLTAGYGWDETDRFLTATTRSELERDAFYIKYDIPIGKGFTITPKYMKIDEGEIRNAGIVNPATDDDTHKLYVVKFNVKF